MSSSKPSPRKLTLAHVTHEAVDHLGGIGTVLQGLITSPVYQQAVGRTILIGPTQTHIPADPRTRLGEHGKVLYSSIDQIDELGLAAKFRPIEWAFNVAIVYGQRTYDPPGEHRHGEAEVLLIDVFRPNKDRLAVFKLRLWERFGLDSSRYDHYWDYEEYVRLAEPAFYALNALLAESELPGVIFAHEFMGLPTTLAAILDGGDRFRTVFHAHECATARHLVENHPGHDTMFYNALREAQQRGLYVKDVFGDLDHLLRHALVRRSHLCDGIIAVGDFTAQELKFLDPHFDDQPIDTVYNGVPVMPVDAALKEKSRGMMLDYAAALLGKRPDVVMTHVTRPVISKGLWRDVRVCHELDAALAAKNQFGVLFILTSAGGTRRHNDVTHMEKAYGWPRNHRSGYPDLVGPEDDLDAMIRAFNAEHPHVQIVLINQFGFNAHRAGHRVPPGMDMADFRRGTDVEFGMATYEPFGISPLEPLCAGAVCVISNVCGCYGFVRHVTRGKDVPNVLVADYTHLERPMAMEHLLAMSQATRDAVEATEAGRIARELVRRLPATAAARAAMVVSGQKLAHLMGWDKILEEAMLPMLNRIVANGG